MLSRWACCPGLGAPQTPLRWGSRVPLPPTPPPLFWLRKELHKHPTQGSGNLAGTGTPRPVSAEQGFQVTTGRQVSTAEQARAEGLGRAGQSTWGWDPHPNPILSTGSCRVHRDIPLRASADRPCLEARAPPGTPLADNDEDPSFQPRAGVRRSTGWVQPALPLGTDRPRRSRGLGGATSAAVLGVGSLEPRTVPGPEYHKDLWKGEREGRRERERMAFKIHP